MAIYHMHMGYISRKTGRSATAHSAYIGCTKLEEARTGLVFDYSRKQGLIHQGILAPEGCPEWVYDRKKLWTAVDAFEDQIAQTRFRGHDDPEKNEKSLRARDTYLETCKTAFTGIFALPLEIKNPSHQIDLSERIIKACYVRKELIADYAIHGDEGNPHLHILTTTRPWDDDTFSQKRFVLEREQLVEMRHLAAEIANDFAKEKGYNYVLDARSYADQGLNIVPTRHLGSKAYHKYTDGSWIEQENQQIHRENILTLFKNPEEIIKIVATQKVVFTQADIEKEIFKRVGGDMTLYSLLKTHLEGIEVSPEMLKVANDNVLTEEDPKADIEGALSSFSERLLGGEDVVSVGKSLKDESVFTTKKMVDLEKSVQRSVRHLCALRGKEMASSLTKAAISRAEAHNEFDFSKEQKRAITYLLKPKALRVLTGKAGTGKTTVLKPVVDTYKQVGYIPLGASFQGNVADLLSHDLQIPAYTLDQFRYYWGKYDKLKEAYPHLKGKARIVAQKELDRLSSYQLTDRHVIILDEGNMVGGNLWHGLFSRVQEAGAHLRIVQDTNQIKALYGSDIARLIEKKAGHFALTEVHRQKEKWMREASTHLNNHDLIEGMKPYEQHGCFVFKESLLLARYALAEAYINHYLSSLYETCQEKQIIALTFQNQEVENLNAAIRHQLKEGGFLGKSFSFKGREFAIGDRVIFTENDHTEWFVKTIESPEKDGSLYDKGVKNGTFGKIEAFDEDQSTLKVRLLKGGRLIHVNLKTYDHLEYGYAMTVNKAEGKTFDWVFGLFDPLMSANKILIWMTRHRYIFQAFISHEHAADINEMALAVGRSEYRPLVSDFGLTASAEAELVKRYMTAAYEAGNLWGIIARENPEAPSDHSEWSDFQAAQNERNLCAGEILDQWDSCRTFVHQVGLKKITLEIQAGLRQRTLNDVELEALRRVEAYRAASYQARMLWDNASIQEHLSKTSSLIKEHEDLVTRRNQLAYEIASFPDLHRPFFKVTQQKGSEDSNTRTDNNKDKVTYATYSGEVYDKIPPSLKAAQSHSQTYINAHHQKVMLKNLTPLERGVVEELMTFKKHVRDCGRLAALLKNQSTHVPRSNKEFLRLKEALEESARMRDFLAFKIVKFFDRYNAPLSYSPQDTLLERVDIDQDQLLKHAVFGEVRQLALKHSLAKNIERRLEIADQLLGMVGEGDKLNKQLYGLLKSMDLEISRLRFEKGCLDIMKRDGVLPFKTVDALSSAFIVLNDYRTTHQEAAKHWHIIKTHATQKVIALQGAQIESLNAWMKTSHLSPDANNMKAKEDGEKSIKPLSWESLGKAFFRIRERDVSPELQVNKVKGGKSKKGVNNETSVLEVKLSLKEAANIQTLTFVTRELTRVAGEYAMLSSSLQETPASITTLSIVLPQDIQTRQVELLHLQNHLRKGRSGYVSIFKGNHQEKRTWENLREKKLVLADRALETCEEVIKVSFTHDYARMQKEAYEHRIGQRVITYQGARREEKASLAAELLLNLEKEGYEGSYTKTQLKNRNENFETLHLYGFFHQVLPELQEPQVSLKALEDYTDAQESFSALWKPRCEIIDKDLGDLKEEFFLQREEFLSHLEERLSSQSYEQDIRHQVVRPKQAFVVDRLIKDISKGVICSSDEMTLETAIQVKLQELNTSFGWKLTGESLEILSHEVKALSYSQDKIHDERLKIMNKTKFENDVDFFASARARNKAAFYLMQTHIGIAIKGAKGDFPVEEYAERHKVALEKKLSYLPSSHSLEMDFPEITENIHFQKNHFFIDKKRVEHALIQNITRFADDIFSSIGEPYNRASSSATERRYGKSAHISVELKTGVWFDHKSYIGGGPLQMLTEFKGFSSVEALKHGASWAGLSQSKLKMDSSQRPLPLAALAAKEKQDREAEEEAKVKIQKAQRFWKKGLPLNGTIAERYLKEHRKIEGTLPSDLRFLPSDKDRKTWKSFSGKSFPGFMAAARSPLGEVTAIQITYLDPTTAAKANIPVAKRSHGILKGSCVTLQEDKGSDILFVAEGVETALSLKEADVKGTIQATLGLSNIRRLAPENPNTKIVICADHDAPGSAAHNNLNKSIKKLQIKGYQVYIIKSDTIGEDLNDVLKQKGPQGVREILVKDLPQELHVVLQDKAFSSKNSPEKSQDAQLHEIKERSFQPIMQDCERELYDFLKKENRALTSELKERVSLQSEKAATFIFHAHTVKGTTPSQKETKLFLLRAKYELDRIPEIRMKIFKEWQYEDNFNEKKDGFIAHMIAERRASIEGRLYLETKQKGLAPPSNIEDLAEKELNDHKSQTKALAQKLSERFSLSEKAATDCAKNMLRYKETHGEKPSEDQISTMVQISKGLEHRDYTHLSKNHGSHEIEFLRRQEGDLHFRYMAQGKILVNHINIQAQVEASLRTIASHITQDLSKLHQKEMSL